MKKIIKIIDWPILFGISQFLITILFSLLFLMLQKNKYPNYTINEIINSENYALNLSNFLSKYSILIMLIMLIIFVPILLKKYQIYKKTNILTYKNKISTILLGTSLAIILNIIIFRINYIINITDRYNNLNNKRLLVNILSSGILGPIIEELIFRGIVYNRLKEITSIKASMIISTIIFALFHFELSQIFYAFLMGFLFVNIYEFYGNLKASIIAHMSANIVITLFIYNIINFSVINQLIIYIISFVIFIISLKRVNYFKKNTKI